MDTKKAKLYCHWDLVRFLEEKHLKGEDGTDFIVSVCEGTLKYELQIFLGKSSTKYEYEVVVYKNKPDDKYVPNKYDHDVSFYEENENFATFYFDDFDSARDFADMLGYVHEEYRVRPIKRI